MKRPGYLFRSFIYLRMGHGMDLARYFVPRFGDTHFALIEQSKASMTRVTVSYHDRLAQGHMF